MNGMQDLALILQDGRKTVAFAESCTGGLLAERATDLAGSSAWFECSLVTYSNRAKQELLGVDPVILETDGAVSWGCACAMAEGLMSRTVADWGISLTGVAGPGGGSPEKPVGLVWIGWIGRSLPVAAERFDFKGDRQQIRQQAAVAAIAGLIDRIRTVNVRS